MTKGDWIFLIVGLVIYQAYATVLVIKSDDFDDDVKLRQVIFIWLIPVIGAVLVRMRLRSAAQRPKR